MCARFSRASSVVSCSPTTRTSRWATRWRSTRRGRWSARCPKAGHLSAPPRSSDRTVEERAYVVLMRVHLFFPEVGSLKGKRAELNRVKALLRERLHVSVAEVAHQDTWQRSTLAVAIAAGTAGGAEHAADDVQRALDSRLPQGVLFERRLASWNDLESLG